MSETVTDEYGPTAAEIDAAASQLETAPTWREAKREAKRALTAALPLIRERIAQRIEAQAEECFAATGYPDAERLGAEYDHGCDQGFTLAASIARGHADGLDKEKR